MKVTLEIKGNPDCLHCWIGAAIEAFMDARNGGMPMSGLVLMAAIASTIADGIYELDEEGRELILASIPTHVRDRNATRKIIEDGGDKFEGARH